MAGVIAGVLQDQSLQARDPHRVQAGSLRSFFVVVGVLTCQKPSCSKTKAVADGCQPSAVHFTPQYLMYPVPLGAQHPGVSPPNVGVLFLP